MTTIAINHQPIEKQIKGATPHCLDVHSIFYTLQGEGPLAGQPAVFARLAGCNLKCPACDTDYTTGRQPMFIADVFGEIGREWAKGNTSLKPLVVITGGEPFRQDISLLVSHALDFGFRVQIETNGTLYQELRWRGHGGRLMVVCSPKTGKVNPKLLPHINAFKYVVKPGKIADDGLPTTALDHPCGTELVARPPEAFPRHMIYVQAIDEKDTKKNSDALQAAVESALRHGYTLCIQTHKIINLP